MDGFPSSPPVLDENATELELELASGPQQEPARVERHQELRNDQSTASSDSPWASSTDGLRPDMEHQQPAPDSSSPPAIFSSDGPLDEQEAGNYTVLKRPKRKWNGSWYEHVQDRHREESRQGIVMRSKMTRNFDSGVFMASDDSYATDAETPSVLSSQESQSDVDARKSYFHKRLNSNHLTASGRLPAYNFDYLNLTEADVEHMSTVLNRVIKEPQIPNDRPVGDEYYRSMIPQLYVNLQGNQLTHIPPCVWEIESLHYLNLRDNKLKELHFSAAKLEHFESLDLCENELTVLPYQLLEPWITGKVRLNVLGNPLVYPEDSYEYFGEAPGPTFCCAPMTYFDELGQPLAVKPEAPLTGIPPAPSLFTLSMIQCAKEASVAELKRLLNNEIPPGVDSVLAIAERTHRMTGQALKTCRVCGEDFVVARAEWIEWWRISIYELPFKAQVCSWACVAR